jgi:hypothetical protein
VARCKPWACLAAKEGIVVRSAFLGIVLVVVNQSAFAVQCLTPTEKIAFDVRALQTELMITALSCGRDNDYSAFVSSHQRDLAAAYDRITRHFARVYGGDGQQRGDTYLTDIANAQSHEKGESNRRFCNRMQPLLYQAMRSLTMDDMAHLVIEWHLTSPHPLAECPN